MFIDSAGRVGIPEDLFSHIRNLNSCEKESQKIFIVLEDDNTLAIRAYSEKGWENYKVVSTAMLDAKRRFSFSIRKQLPQEVIDNAILFLEEGILKIRLR